MENKNNSIYGITYMLWAELYKFDLNLNKSRLDGPTEVEQDLICGLSPLDDQKPGEQQIITFHAILASGGAHDDDQDVLYDHYT